METPRNPAALRPALPVIGTRHPPTSHTLKRTPWRTQALNPRSSTDSSPRRSPRVTSAPAWRCWRWSLGWHILQWYPAAQNTPTTGTRPCRPAVTQRALGPQARLGCRAARASIANAECMARSDKQVGEASYTRETTEVYPPAALKRAATRGLRT